MKKIMGMMLLAVLCITGMASMDVKAASSRSLKKKWAKQYMNVMKEIDTDKSRKYDLIYFDNDSIPELVVDSTGYWLSMYTYDKKTDRAVLVMERWPYYVSGIYGYEYLPKKNVLYYSSSSGAGTIRGEHYEKMKNYKMVDRNKKSLTMMYFNDENHNCQWDEGETTLEQPYYYYGNKRVSEKNFKKYTVKGKYKLMKGKKNYKQMKKKLKSY